MILSNKPYRIGPLYVENPTMDLYQRYTFESENMYGEFEITHSFLKYKQGIMIPRYGFPNPISISLNEGKDINIKCNAKPRNQSQQDAVDFILKNNDCIVNYKPGKGKTVISIMALCKIKKKTLILVDQDNILNQWIDRIVEYTNLSKSHIGIIKGDKTDINKPIVIAMIQTLKNRVIKDIDLIRDQLKDFGIVFVDEIHTIIGTDKLNLALYATSSKRLIGLTATLFRSDDKNHLFYEWFSNNVITDLSFDIVPTIYMVPLKMNLNRKEIRYIMFNYIKDKNGETKVKEFLNKGKWIKKLIQRENSIKIIQNILNIMYFKYNRNIITVSEHIDLLQVIAKDLSNMDIGLYTGKEGSTKKIKKVLKAERNLDKKVIFTTYKMCGKAIDKPEWDCLLMTTPVSATSPALEQIIGRVCRRYKNKNDAIVIDFYDNSVPRMASMTKGRKNYYKRQNFNIIEF